MTVIDDKNRNKIKERLVALTRDLIIIPSNPARPEDRQRCYEFIKNHLETLENIEVREFEKDGIPSLVAAPPGCHNPEVLLCGHLDVITHPDVSSYHSHIDAGRIYGPGAGDMKGCLAILMEVFHNVHAHHPNTPLGIAVTADEETGGVAGIGYLLKEKGLRCAQAMIPDGGSINRITVEEKGILHLKAEYTGHSHSAHAARPWLGENAVEHLMDKTGLIRQYFEKLKRTEDHWYPTCAVTVFATKNQTTNRIPSTASVVMDIRFPPPFTVKKLLTKITELVGKDVKIDQILSDEPSQLSPDPLFQKITEDVTGQKTELIQDDGGSDARYFAAKQIPVVMSRPEVGNLHDKDEWINIDSMVTLYEIYERYLFSKLKLQ